MKLTTAIIALLACTALAVASEQTKVQPPQFVRIQPFLSQPKHSGPTWEQPKLMYPFLRMETPLTIPTKPGEPYVLPRRQEPSWHFWVQPFNQSWVYRGGRLISGHQVLLRR